MLKETVSLSAKEQQRVMVLNQVQRGELTGRQAAALMRLSLRQVRRLLAGYRKDGVAALAHGNRGRGPAHAIPEETRKRVVALAQDPYGGLNHQHLQELLAEREGLALSRSSVWRILRAWPVPAGAGRPSTVAAGSAFPRRGCCSRWTAAATIGYRAGVPT